MSEAFRHTSRDFYQANRELSDNSVPRGTTARLDRIEGDLKVGRGARIEASSGNLVSVSGAAYFDGAAVVACDFECDTLRVASGGALEIEGNLTVRKLLDVNHSVKSSGTIRAQDIDVGGRIEANSISCTRMRVGGKIEVDNLLEVETLTVGGRVEAMGVVAIKDFDVGGQAEIGGGKISGQIRVGGRFESKSKLEFGDMQVLGRTRLAAQSKGTRIATHGQLMASGDLECDEVSIFGKSEIEGNLKSRKIKVDGMLEVHGSLEAQDILEINGSVEVDRNIQGTDIHAGGRLEASRILATGEILIAGWANTRDGLRAKSVRIRSGSRVEGPIVADELVDVGKSYAVLLDWEKSWLGQVAAMRLIGKMTRVEDIYADVARLGKASKCDRVFARVVELEEGVVGNEIEYTGEITGDLSRVHFERAPHKVDRLPQPPIPT